MNIYARTTIRFCKVLGSVGVLAVVMFGWFFLPFWLGLCLLIAGCVAFLWALCYQMETGRS